MRPTMVFYNHCLEGETLSAIVAFPYTPKMLDDMSPAQLYALGKMFGLSCEASNASPLEMIKQKLLDMWYAVEDSPRMHAIVPCQSLTKNCVNLASSLNINCMCKDCNEDWANRLPSLIHDSHDQFFRFKLRKLCEFEEEKKFDRKMTLRVTMRRMIRRHVLTKYFEDYDIDWDKMEIFFNPLTHRMQYVYLVCRTAEEAKRLLLNRHHLISKAKARSMYIESIPNSVGKAHSLFQEPENVAALVKPPSNMEVVAELPMREELLKQLQNVVQVLTQLDYTQFTIETDICPISGEKDYRQFYVVLPKRSYVNRVYNAQPFFGCVLCLKLTHAQIAPYMKYSDDVCLMCDALKVRRAFWI